MQAGSRRGEGERILSLDSLSDQEIAPYLEGRLLYGDDFDADRIRDWFATEEEAYAELWGKDRQTYQYEYHALNRTHGFEPLPSGHFETVLGFGSGYADEFLPIAKRVGKLIVLEPSEQFRQSPLAALNVEMRKPNPSGELDFADNSFDLIVCLSVMHHIPNVSYVLSELARVLRPGGHMILREPVVSMGDWRKIRPGLTRYERGIPLDWLRERLKTRGLRVVNESLCVFPVTHRLKFLGNGYPFNSRLAMLFDRAMSWMFGSNTRYHATHWWHKLRPSTVFMVLTK